MNYWHLYYILKEDATATHTNNNHKPNPFCVAATCRCHLSPPPVAINTSNINKIARKLSYLQVSVTITSDYEGGVGGAVAVSPSPFSRDYLEADELNHFHDQFVLFR